jgi:RNA recognition motif-containing protein
LKRIYIGNLSFQTTEETIEAAFAAFGTVQSVSIVRDRQTGQSRGFAFVEMEKQQEADAAIAGLNQQQLDGRIVSVNEARARSGGSGRGGGRGSPRGRGRRW